MEQPSSQQTDLTVELNLNEDHLKLSYSKDSFRPNRVTEMFARAIQNIRGVVFDIGTGVAPLAIYAARHGAQKVYAVDPVEEHIDLARKNVKAYNLESKIDLYLGEFFRPLHGLKKKADIIIADISGIADKAARALGWNPEQVPTGGEDGTEKIINVLEQAPDYLADNGELYFPIATDLSDGKKIMDVAKKHSRSIREAFDSALRFVLSKEQYAALLDAYNQKLPGFINLVQQGSRYVWTGQIYIASNPK